jgi:hypothetical protein
MQTASQEPPPRRFIAGADAITTVEQKIADLKAQIEAERNLTLLPLDPTTLKRERTVHYGINGLETHIRRKLPQTLIKAREKAQTALNKTSEQIKATGCFRLACS